MNHQSLTLKTIIRKDFVRIDGTAAITLRVTIDRQRVYIPLKIHAKPESFDEAQGRVVGKMADRKGLNLVIQQAEARANEIFVDYRLMRKKLSKEVFKSEFENPMYRKDFIEFMRSEIGKRRHSGNYSEKTLGKYDLTLKRLLAFRPAIPMTEITTGLLDEFDQWHSRFLRQNKRNLISNGRAARHNVLKDIRTFINIAIKSGIKLTNPFQNYSLPKVGNRPVFLSKTEVSKLWDYYHSSRIHPTEKAVLRYFLFSCYTAVRFGDIANLTQDNIQNGYLVYSPQKGKNRTPKLLRIPLCGQALELVGNEYQLFRVISNQKSNDYLRAACRVAGVETYTSYHVSRHTFASLWRQSGGSAEVLQQIMGHSSLKVTMAYYVHVNDDRKGEEMNDFSSFMK